MKILVLCHGSSCRSPMAKALLDAELRSSGVNAVVTARALHVPAPAVAQEAIDVMRSYGLDIRDHIPIGVTDGEVDDANLVLLMDQSLLRSARSRWPAAEHKLWRMMEFATGEPSDIKDPIDDPSEYDMAAGRLAKAARAVARKVLEEPM